MRRLTAAALALAVMSIAVVAAGVWWGQSLTYQLCAASVFLITAAVWWVWAWKKMAERGTDRPGQRFL